MGRTPHTTVAAGIGAHGQSVTLGDFSLSGLKFLINCITPPVFMLCNSVESLTLVTYSYNG